MKHPRSCLLLLTLCALLPFCVRARAFTAVVTSDLHFVHDREVYDGLVPGMSLSDDITDALIAQVLDLAPDLFILTGDNTNNGYAPDAQALSAQLSRLREAGILVVITTGNHDLDRVDAQDFADIYFPLVNAQMRDPVSLSYVTLTEDAAFFAMDDSSFTGGSQGQFSQETMDWLDRALQRYEGRELIFLSHHSVMAAGSYDIGNGELEDLLRRHGVRLCLTGHLHSQQYVVREGLHELISGMPFSAPHQVGLLSLQGHTLSYEAIPIDLDRYGREGLAQELADKDAATWEILTDTFASYLDQHLPPQEAEPILALTMTFFSAYTRGTLGEQLPLIRQDPWYEAMLRAFAPSNYGLWMQQILEGEPRNADAFTIPAP